jgi:hypothetical protein
MEKCKNCEIIHNGSIIKVSEDGRCIFCGRKVGSSMPNNTKKEATLNIKNFHCSEHGFIKPQPSCPKCISPQSPLSEERWCAKALDNLKEARLQGQRDEREKWGVVARKDFKQSDIVAPSSNEDWEKEFDDRFELESQGCSECGGFELVDRREERYPKGKYHCEYDLEKIKDFILQQRLAAQRSLAEEIIKQLGEEPKIIDGIKTGMMAWTREGIIDFLTARGLLPKITE